MGAIKCSMLVWRLLSAFERRLGLLLSLWESARNDDRSLTHLVSGPLCIRGYHSRELQGVWPADLLASFESGLVSALAVPDQRELPLTQP